MSLGTEFEEIGGYRLIIENPGVERDSKRCVTIAPKTPRPNWSVAFTLHKDNSVDIKIKDILRNGNSAELGSIDNLKRIIELLEEAKNSA